MKSSIAAMIVAVERLFSKGSINGRIGFLITSDEEGPAINGTVKVVKYLEDNNTKIDWCVVGEPTSTEKLGDVIKNGRRGSLNGDLTIKGKQGQFNFRFSTELTTEDLKRRVTDILDAHELDYELNWSLTGNPFITGRGELVNATVDAIKKVTSADTELSTSGGTSDGRFIAPTGAQVLELGPCNATIHQIDENVTVAELDTLTDVYEELLSNLLHKKSTTA